MPLEAHEVDTGRHIMESDYSCFDNAIDLLAINKLADIDASLIDMSDAEKKERRIRYLHDAIKSIGPGRPFMESLESFAKSMSLIFLPLALIFMFLPLFIVTRCKLMIKRGNINRQLNKALAYWKINRQELDYFQRANPVGSP